MRSEPRSRLGGSPRVRNRVGIWFQWWLLLSALGRYLPIRPEPGVDRSRARSCGSDWALQEQLQRMGRRNLLRLALVAGLITGCFGKGPGPFPTPVTPSSDNCAQAVSFTSAIAAAYPTGALADQQLRI